MALTIKSSNASGHSKDDVARSVSELIKSSPDDPTLIMIILRPKSGDYYAETVTTELWDAIGRRNFSDVPQRILMDLLRATSSPKEKSVEGLSEQELAAELRAAGVPE